MLPLLNGLEHVDGDPGAVRRLVVIHQKLVLPSRAGSIGRLEAFSPEPGVVVQRSAGNAVVTAASRELDDRRSTPRSSRSAFPASTSSSATTSVPSSGRRRPGSRCWRRRRWRAAAPSGRSARTTAWRPRLVEALARGVRGGRRRRRRARCGRPMGDHRGHARRSHHVRGARRRVRDARPSSTRSRGPSSAPAEARRCQRRRSRRCWPMPRRGPVQPHDDDARAGTSPRRSARSRRIRTVAGAPSVRAPGRARRRRPLRARGRRARARPVPGVRVGLRPRDLHPVHLAARAPPRAVQHDRPAHPARRPRRAGDRPARAARHDRHGRARDPARADARPGGDRAAPVPPRARTRSERLAGGGPGLLSGAPRPSSCTPRSSTSIPNGSCRCCSSEAASRSLGGGRRGSRRPS